MGVVMFSHGMAHFPSSRLHPLCFRICETSRNSAVAAAERAEVFRVQLCHLYEYLHNIYDNRVCHAITAVPAEPEVSQPTS
jgi:hypothetical protein